MKPVSNDFKTELLKFGREYQNKIGIFDYDVLATEANDYLVTEDDKDIIARVSATEYETELDDEDLFSVKLITKGEILSTLMKELEFVTPEEIEVGRVVDYRFGLKARSGKNLLNISEKLVASRYGIDATYNDNSSITLEGTATANNRNITNVISGVMEQGKTYTLTVIGEKNFNIRVDLRYLDLDSTMHTYSITLNSNETTKNIPIPIKYDDYGDEMEFNSFQIYMSGLTRDASYNSTLFLQIEEGETATSYEPYGYYEYINYGKFIVYKKEYDEVTENYTYTCYDFMLRSMKTIGSEFRVTSDTITGANLLKKICEILLMDFDDSIEDANNKPTPYGMIGHKDQDIKMSTVIQYKLTYRDLLGLLCQYFGVSMYMDNNELKLKLLGNIEYDETEQEWIVNNDTPLIVDTLSADYLKDSNVSFKEKYGKINALEITGIDESKQQYVQDGESISTNGLTLYAIQKNILFNDTEVFDEYGHEMAEDIFKMLNGIDYEMNEVSTNGVLFLEWLDFYNVVVKGTTYKCLLLNSEITIKSGIEESIYTDMPTETVEEYTSNPSNRDDVIADSLRARGNVYGTNVEASGRVDATTIEASGTINATAVGPELEEVIRQISPGGGAEIPIQDTAPENPQEDDLWIDTSSEGGTDILQLVYPVGSIYMSVNSTNPSTLFGGTWVSWGAGRVPVGVDTSQTEFDTVEETGGTKTHSHGFASGNAWANIGSPNSNANALGFAAMAWHGTKSTYSVGNTSSSQASGHPNRSHDTSLGGSTDGATTLQPYITCYMWKRTA